MSEEADVEITMRQSQELSCRLLIESIERNCLKQYLISIVISRDKSSMDEKYE